MAKRKPKGEDFQEFNTEVPTPGRKPKGSSFQPSNLEDTQPKKPKRKPRPRWVNVLCAVIALGFCAYSASLGSNNPPAPANTLVPTAAINSIAAQQEVTAAEPSARPLPTETPTVTPSATITETATLQPTLPPPTATVMVAQPQLVIATNTIAVFTPEPGLIMTLSPAETFYAGTGGANLRSCPDTSCTALGKLDTGAPIQVDAYINGKEVDAGNAIWYRTGYNGQIAYAYSGVMGKQPPAAPVAGGGGSTGQSVIPIQSQPQQTWNCVGDIYNCGDLTCDQIRNYFAACPGDPSDLDGDKNGSPCESQC